jgi:tetrathionate reductase subunit B
MTKSNISRRKFLFGIGAGAIIPSSLKANAEGLADRTRNKVRKLLYPESSSQHQNVRMTQDLKRALQKPIAQRKWKMVIDAQKCIGCNACAVACIAANNLPPGITYRKVIVLEDGDYPDVRSYYMPTNCMQCENPPCVKAANDVIEGSMSVREDGIVAINYSKMKGKKVFQAAKKACPYSFALYYDEGKNYTDDTPAVQPYERTTAFEYGKEVSRRDTKDRTRKCHFCIDRIERGILPACVSTCTGGAMMFGDINDPRSLVSEYLNANDSFKVNEYKKTLPSVFYIHDKLDQSCLKCHE